MLIKKIAFFELEKWEEKYLLERLRLSQGWQAVFYNRALTPSLLKKIKDVEILAVFIYSHITPEVIKQLPKLKFIATMSTGFDHVDLTSCRSRKIPVSNVPFYGENTVAEHTLALILALSRKLAPSLEGTKKGDFSLDGLRGFDLKGKTIGLVGLGHIGWHVARMAQGLEMKILACDPKPDKIMAKKLGVKYVSFEYLLGNSDVVSLHAPYNKNTQHLLNQKNIKLIKRGAYLINTARGGLIETEALLKALKHGIIAGAGLDVLEEEYFIKEEKELLTKSFKAKCDLKTALQNHLLLQTPNVIITPHNAFNSDEALRRILDTTIDNILGYIKKRPKNLVK